MTIYISLLFAGLCALLQCVLTLLVVVRRVKIGVNLQDGGDEPLLRRIRAHGNFAETVPLALLLLALLELHGLPAAWLWCLGSALLLGRLFHVYGLLGKGARNRASEPANSAQPQAAKKPKAQGVMWSRLLGMVLTLTVLSVQGVVSIWLFWRSVWL